MKTSYITFLVSLLLLNGANGLCQDSKLSPWKAFFGGGFSFPVGQYSSNKGSESAILDPNVPFTRIIGFSKKANGFAKTGYSFNFEIGYRLTSSIRLFFLSSHFSNPVNTEDISTYLVQATGNNQIMEESYYKITFFSPGLGYEKSINRFDLGFKFFAGYSIAEFPYYKIVLSYTMLDPPPIFAHEGDRPNLSALNLGCGISALYNISLHLNIGIDALYDMADFHYDMSNTLIPGGSQVFQISDILKVRVFNACIKLGYRF